MASRKIAIITRSSLQDLIPSDDAYITNVKSMSSYNWIDGPSPTIAVPGSPALWTPPEHTLRLQKDSGWISTAENSMRLPDSPMEPLFRALYTTKPSFDVRSIDVISERHTIRKLLSFVNPGSGRDSGEAYTMKLELVRNTLLLCRDVIGATEYIGPHDFRGYGHEFEKAYTTSQIAGSTSHFRIISYRFCGLKFMIRHETDGFVQSESEGVVSIDAVSYFLETLSLSSLRKASGAPNSNAAKLTVLRKGKTVPLESTLEVKTRAVRKPLSFDDVAPQLWVSQTPKLVRAYHYNGHFSKPRVEDVKAKIQEWEDDNQENLRTLGALIHEIIRVMKSFGGRGQLQYDVAMDSLIISRVEEAGMLPEDLYSKWDE
ncbi:hypothetical protein E4U55_007110 [Claviceps digitariae]|nr:hypothetical protein E4U55_007110 [Claviceps digitariae]